MKETMEELKRENLLRAVAISSLFGILDFHYQEKIGPFVEYIFKGRENAYVLLLLIIVILTPWYCLSIYSYFLSNKDSRKFIDIFKHTVILFMTAIFSYYIYYSLLVLALNYSNTLPAHQAISYQNIQFVFEKLLVPGLLEWGTGGIILASVVSYTNFLFIPTAFRLFSKFKGEV